MLSNNESVATEDQLNRCKAIRFVGERLSRRGNDPVVCSACTPPPTLTTTAALTRRTLIDLDVDNGAHPNTRIATSSPNNVQNCQPAITTVLMTSPL